MQEDDVQTLRIAMETLEHPTRGQPQQVVGALGGAARRITARRSSPKSGLIAGFREIAVPIDALT
jgi:hypothetical protein